MRRTVPNSTQLEQDARRQRGRAVDYLSGVISVALFSGYVWWFLTLIAESVVI